MTDAHGVARDQLRAFIERIERLEEEKKSIADDIKDVYGEAKGTGFDTKILREVIKIRKQDRDERAEREAILDSYLIALGMIDQPSFFDDEPAQPAPAARQPAMALRSDGGLSILTKHEDIRTAPVTAGNEPEAAAEVAGDYLREPVAAEQGQIIREGDAPRETDRLGGDASGPDTEFQVGGNVHISTAARNDAGKQGVTAGETATHSEKATLATQGEVTEPTSAEREDSAAANAGGTDVARSATRAGLADPTSNTGEGAANTALPESDQFIEDVPPTPMKRLNYAHCFPELTKAEYGLLEFSIIGIGISKPIIRMGDVIVDGWARYNIARALGISYPVKSYSGNDVLLDVIEWQRASRNFTPAQERKIAADLAKEITHRADDIMAAFGLAEALEAAE